MPPWDREFERILRTFIPSLEPELPLTGDEAMSELGVDSMSVVQLVIALEEAYSVTFPDESLTQDRLNTPLAVWAALAEVAAI